MVLTGLELTNFRSYTKREFGFGPRLTLVAGPNASGKTNLLEAVYVLATTKSFRAKDADLIRYDQSFWRIEGQADQTDLAMTFRSEAGRTEKKVKHNQVKQPLVKHIGNLPVTLFEPRDLELATSSPEGRRRYLDLILCQTDPNYLLVLQRYRRVLAQRNRLLDNFDIGGIKKQIFVWDLKLTELAGLIVKHRLALIEHLNGLVEQLYRDIAGDSAGLKLAYLPSIEGADYDRDFMAALAANLTRDLAAGFTTIGPHREDFRISFKSNPINLVASRGEMRTVILALKLAELRYLEISSGRRPTLLLDDVFSELDQNRRHYLMNCFSDYQTIITTTDADAIMQDTGSDLVLIETAPAADRA